MAGVLAALRDKRSRAMKVARFRAWWEGEEFDEAAATAAIEEALAAEAQKAEEKKAEEKKAEEKKAEEKKPPAEGDAKADAPADALFDEAPPEPPARIAGLQKFWGEGRLMPGDDAADALQPARLGVSEEGILAVVGPGLAAPILALAGAHKGKLIALEWREDARAAIEFALARAKLAPRVELRAVELDEFVADAAAFDGLISFDEFTYAADAAALAAGLAAALKPNACAVIETYAAVPNDAFAPAFATSFAEPHLRPAGDIAEALEAAGLAVEANEDQTEEHVEATKAGFRRLGDTLQRIAEQGIAVPVLQEIAWEAAAQRARVKLMTQKRLERRQIVARKRA